jgi:15-cis-phytoene desaturase
MHNVCVFECHVLTGLLAQTALRTCVSLSHFTGRNKYRPSQVTPIPHFTMAGDWTSQKFLGSMEGAVLGGKLAAEVVARRAKGMPEFDIKEIQPDIVEAAATHVAKDPAGVKGEGAIAFGGGATLGKKEEKLLREVDPSQFVAAA